MYEKSRELRHFPVLPCPEESGLAPSRATELDREGEDEENGFNGRRGVYNRSRPGSHNGNRGFKYHFLLGADWKLCTRQLKIDRGNFFHAVYRIEQKLGRVFRELEPYPLYPLEEYFHGQRRPVQSESRHAAGPAPLRVPLRTANQSLLLRSTA